MIYPQKEKREEGGVFWRRKKKKATWCIERKEENFSIGLFQTDRYARIVNYTKVAVQLRAGLAEEGVLWIKLLQNIPYFEEQNNKTKAKVKDEKDPTHPTSHEQNTQWTGSEPH
jgi:hypothetical protein